MAGGAERAGARRKRRHRPLPCDRLSAHWRRPQAWRIAGAVLRRRAPGADVELESAEAPESGAAVGAEPAVAADGAGIVAFRGIQSSQPAPLLNLVVRVRHEVAGVSVMRDRKHDITCCSASSLLPGPASRATLRSE